jgi:hypothetical protein
MMNPWVSQQIASQHVSDLWAEAAEARRLPRARRRRPHRPGVALRLRWPVRNAVGCEA